MRNILLISILVITSTIRAQQQPDSLEYNLQEVVVQEKGTRFLKSVPTNTQLITARELTRAACCNLGESFTTNPSVDVNYSDAATGARQIKLLGLSGAYVQMLTENVPAFRGGAAPFGLSYIPGPWMQSLQVSKGASSVKNGYESVTGQINIELRKPQLDPSFSANAYVDHFGKAEVNLLGNTHLGDKWSTGVLTHVENTFRVHDGDDDGFVDMPRVRQASLMNRWAYLGSKYVFQAAAKGTFENRRSGQIGHHQPDDPYIIDIDTRRFEIFTKQAIMYDRDNGGNVALILSANNHNLHSYYGRRFFNLNQWEGYASLMFERNWNEIHAISTGASFNIDNFDRRYSLSLMGIDEMHNSSLEAVTGVYSQYTLNLHDRIIAMAGIRYDYNSIYGSLVTPRFHIRYIPVEGLSFSGSAGIGRRSPHPLEEFNNMLASSRVVTMATDMKMEKAANYGITAQYDWDWAGRHFSLEAEYYYTRFSSWLCADNVTDPHRLTFFSSTLPCRSHTFQIQATADIVNDMSLTVAYRHNDSKADFGHGLVTRPLTPRYKALFSLDYRPMMGLWQFDVTASLNGSGYMPESYITSAGEPAWGSSFPAIWNLNVQVTRNFRHWSVYIGGENLTNYRQRNPIIDASDPWGPDFDATMVYGPLHGAMIYAGFRFNITRYL